jgi:hypothetical protein
MFIASGKHNYAAMSVRFLHILESLHPDVVKVYEEYKVFSFSGNDGTGMPCDAMMELVYILYLCDKYYIYYTQIIRYIKRMNKKRPAFRRLTWTTRALNWLLGTTYSTTNIVFF